MRVGSYSFTILRCNSSNCFGSTSPGASIIKAFNAMYASYIAAKPRHSEGRQVVFYAGDDRTSCADFDELVSGLGFAPVYVGGLRDGGKLMQIGGPLSTLHVIKQD